jgi:hypothetical protein
MPENIHGYIVQLEPGVWLAPWEGDPGRTLVMQNAKVWKRKTKAQKRLRKARELRPFDNARVIPVHLAAITDVTLLDCAAYLVDRADQLDSCDGYIGPMIDVAQAIVQGEVQTAKDHGELDKSLYTRLDSWARMERL